MQGLAVCGGEQLGRKRPGGNPHMSFANHKRRCYKAERAPGRALTQDERKSCEEMVAREWAEIKRRPQELSAWEAVCFAEALRRQAGADEDDSQPAGSAPSFSGVWGLSNDKNHILPPGVLVERGLRKPSTQSERSVAWHDPGLNVREAQGRYKDIIGGWSRLPEGCHDVRAGCGRA